MRLPKSAGVVLGIGVLALSGCAPMVCAGAAQGLPTMDLEAGPWLSAHRGASADVCLVTNCAELTPTQTLAGIQVQSRSADDRYDLVVRSSGAVVARERVRLVDGTVDGACGTITVATTIDLVLQADGRITTAIRPTGP
ncbi:hypothetical protein [Microbacterium panaciterrae]|uniref:Uncharacterized protein n=1 Tax=Microbacterium panaciterrae TaxID=985759 RepID=A0ABP8PKI6_9MICO